MYEPLAAASGVFAAVCHRVTIRCSQSTRRFPALPLAFAVRRGLPAWSLVEFSRLQPVQPALKFLKDFWLIFCNLEVSL